MTLLSTGDFPCAPVLVNTSTFSGLLAEDDRPRRQVSMAQPYATPPAVARRLRVNLSALARASSGRWRANA